jgi:Flp pilus assembly protein TadD
MVRFFAFPLAAIIFWVSLAYAQGRLVFEEEGRWKEGKTHLAEGRAKAAKGAFEDLLLKYPREPALLFLLGIVALRSGEVEAAESHVKRLLELAPDHAEGRTLLGWMSLEVRKDFPAAIEAYSRVVQLRANTPEAHSNLGVAFKKNGNLDKALESFNQALDLRRDYTEAWSNRGWVYIEQRKWLEARKDFEQALELNPKDEGALYGMSQALRGSRDYAGAQRVLSTLTGQSSNFVYWLEWAQLGLVRFYWVLLLVAIGVFLRSRYRKKA